MRSFEEYMELINSSKDASEAVIQTVEDLVADEDCFGIICWSKRFTNKDLIEISKRACDKNKKTYIALTFELAKNIIFFGYYDYIIISATVEQLDELFSKKLPKCIVCMQSTINPENGDDNTVETAIKNTKEFLCLRNHIENYYKHCDTIFSV
jgi:hypothetical protein